MSSAPLSSAPPKSITVVSPAKINLHLGVGAPREDGYHPLDTVYQALDLTEQLTVSEGVLELEIETAAYVDRTALPLGPDNLLARAADALSRFHGREVCGRMVLTKSIPVAGGLAGGSSDAAAALVALDALHGLETGERDLMALAAQLGSDVPFLLVGGTAHGGGRGEVVVPIVDTGTWHWVIVPSESGGLSTPAVYRRFDELFPDASQTPRSSAELVAALASGDPRRLAGCLHNDLEPAAIDLRPDLAEVLARGEAEGALRGMVSGSGPSLIFLCSDKLSQAAVAVSLGKTCATVLTAQGPVPGARVVSP